MSYVLSDNYGVAQGVYCAMYTEGWDASYGTVTESAYGGAQWTVGNVAAYMNATYATSYQAICAGSNCTQGSYQGGSCGGWDVRTC